MYGLSDYIFDLKCEVRSLRSQVEAFRTGKRYTKMREAQRMQIAEKDREIRRVKAEVANAHGETVTVRENWLQVIGDLEKEHANEIRKKERRIKELEARALRAERERDDALNRLGEKRLELYAALTELEDVRERNAKLVSQIRRDHENSSLPSSAKPNRKPIANGREKTGKKPGGQPGHEGHGRRKLSPTRTIPIKPPAEYTDGAGYRPTGRIITKQLVNIVVGVTVDQYETPEFRNTLTGQRAHAVFPPGVMDDVNYGGSVKALAFLLNTDCCVSIDKTRRLLTEITGGALKISKGMIAGLCAEFSEKTAAERSSAFADLLLEPVMNTDFTSARVNGGNKQVCVCAAPRRAMYFARESKGKDGVKGTPVMDYQGILVHDHDRTFYGYGGSHQECLAHILRYLLDGIQNEPGREWHGRMRSLLQEMIHTRNSLSDDEALDEDAVGSFETRYEAVLKLAENEYEYEPPGKYYRDGYNLSVRLREYMDSTLLFLRDPAVPSDNNLSERLLRIFKRKQKQMMSMRSFGSLEYLCDCLGVIVTMRMRDENIFEGVAKAFG